MVAEVRSYYLKPTHNAPNSRLPVLLYQNVLPKPLTEDKTTEFLTCNKWEKRGTWGHIAIRHFHPNSHECYGIFQGYSTLLIGSMNLDEGTGMTISVKAGDVVVLPAGTAHSSIESSPEYRYIGVYPNGCPAWRNEIGRKPSEVFSEMIASVELPHADPVYGEDGPLMRFWQEN